jgi:DNA-binding MarR family transcriptional regulator
MPEKVILLTFEDALSYSSTMQSLLVASISAGDHACANDLLDTVPLVMRVIRKHLRRHRSGLSVAQFRTLWHISTTTGHSLSAVAGFIGLSLPAMSRLVEGLVEKKLVLRKTCDKDRRHVRLSLTPSGETALREARELAEAHVAQSLTQLTSEQKTTLCGAMEILRTVFSSEEAAIEPAEVEQIEVEKD